MRSLDLEFQDHPESILCLWEEVERCQKLKRQRSQDSNKPQTPGSNKEQGVFEALTHNWAGLGAATQEALVKAGFQPPEKEEVDPPLEGPQG